VRPGNLEQFRHGTDPEENLADGFPRPANHDFGEVLTEIIQLRQPIVIVHKRVTGRAGNWIHQGAGRLVHDLGLEHECK